MKKQKYIRLEKYLPPHIYGNPIIGIWFCPICGKQHFPRELYEKKFPYPFHCETCKMLLVYDEEA